MPFSGQHCCIVPNVKHEIIDILVPLLVSDDRSRHNFVACIDKRCLDLLKKTKQSAHTEGTNTRRSVSPAEEYLSPLHLSGCVLLLYYVRFMLRTK